MNSIALIAIIAVFAAAPAFASANCHNITGTCLGDKFVCANDEAVPASKRCNGVEDCADGTDEYMCHSPLRTPLHLESEQSRAMHAEASCIKCTCQASLVNIPSTSGWWFHAQRAPLSINFQTNPSANRNQPCSLSFTTVITIRFNKKNRICRGWVCCAQQDACQTCSGGKLTTNRCI